MTGRCDRPTLLAVATVSLAVLGYEVLLLRLFAIIQWHHFAYMAISVALLGFGAAGTFLYFAQSRLKPAFRTSFAVFAASCGVTAVLGFALAQRVPFNALEVMWEPRQFLYLLAMYGLLVVPFFAGAACIGLALLRYPESIGPIYGSNLLGSAGGALGAIGLLYLIPPEQILRLIAGLGLLGAGLAFLSPGRHRRRAAALLFVAALTVPLGLPDSWTAPRVSPYKNLSRALLVPGARVLFETNSPLGHLSVVESQQVPFRHAPGLSLNNTKEPPAQLAVFTDGDGFTAITAFNGDLEPFSYLDFTTSALPYHLLERPRVLVVGAGGGSGILQALYHEATAVDAVELDGALVRLVGERYREFAGRLYQHPGVRVHLNEARNFVAGHAGNWDVIQLPLVGAQASSAGAQGMNESFVDTVEAFAEYVRKLRPGGYLAVTVGLRLPPRAGLKLFATAVETLNRLGVEEPARHLALVRGWSTLTLLLKKGGLDEADTDRIRRFAAARSFDLAHLPGMKPEEANTYNILHRPYYHEAATALLSDESGDFVGRYKFDIRPATDERPYSSNYFRWRTLPELFDLWRSSGGALLDWGYPLLVMTLVQAAVVSLVLILLPLAIGRRSFAPTPAGWRVLGYFLCLGLAFLFVEIAFIQRFVLFLGHPIFAVALALTGFLAFAGMGSIAAPGFEKRVAGSRFGRAGSITIVVLGIAVLSVGYIAVLPSLFGVMAALSGTVKSAVVLILIAPLAFLMGMPFPLGLARVSGSLPELVPWAWGVNGCFSVISSVLAVILAIHIGFSGVVGAAAVTYLLAAGLLSGLKPDP